jgi:hypothetical protein
MTTVIVLLVLAFVVGLLMLAGRRLRVVAHAGTAATSIAERQATTGPATWGLADWST